LLLTDNYHTTSIKEYLNNLVDDIINLLSNKQNLTVEKQIDDFQLDPKTLFSIGLITNELLTNVMKYAFKNRDSGLIQITLKEHDGKATLTIQDDGNGLPDGFDIDKQEGFGLMLIKMLCEQLDGSFTIENHIGTRSTVKFSI
jgi:two-component sensor histidine kinase